GNCARRWAGTAAARPARKQAPCYRGGHGPPRPPLRPRAAPNWPFASPATTSPIPRNPSRPSLAVMQPRKIPPGWRRPDGQAGLEARGMAHATGGRLAWAQCARAWPVGRVWIVLRPASMYGLAGVVGRGGVVDK